MPALGLRAARRSDCGATLGGAILGTLVVSWSKSLISESYPDAWQYIFGALFAGSVVFFSKGVLGAATALLSRFLPRAATEET